MNVFPGEFAPRTAHSVHPSRPLDPTDATESVVTRALQIFEPDHQAVFTIDEVAHIAGMPRHMILVCCRHGLVAPVGTIESQGFSFDGRTVETLMRISYLHTTCAINFVGVRMILGLINRVEQLAAGDADGREQVLSFQSRDCAPSRANGGN